MEKVDEIGRKLIHILVGFLIIDALDFLGREYALYLMSFILVALSVLINLKVRGFRIPIFDDLINLFERDVRFPGVGSALYLVGVLLIMSSLQDPQEIMASIIILSFGDGLATIIGKRGNTPLPYNRKKTFEGTAAFFLAAASSSYLVLGTSGIIVSAIASIVESIDFKVDDNISVPICCILVFRYLV